MSAAAYDPISKDYAALVGRDPSKRYVQYPWAMAQLVGEIRGSHILDVGCGEGSLPRVLARAGACVCGYDNSSAQIDQANLLERNESQGISYVLADPRDVTEKIQPSSFDSAVSTSVLHYAESREHLASFFASTYALLRPGGQFAALVFNPDFERFDQLNYHRVYSRVPGKRLRVDFFDAAQKRCSAYYSDFSRPDYEDAAAQSGWESFAWKPVTVSKEGREHLGDFWAGFEEDCPYIGLNLKKSS